MYYGALRSMDTDLGHRYDPNGQFETAFSEKWEHGTTETPRTNIFHMCKWKQLCNFLY